MEGHVEYSTVRDGHVVVVCRVRQGYLGVFRVRQGYVGVFIAREGHVRRSLYIRSGPCKCLSSKGEPYRRLYSNGGHDRVCMLR